MTVAALPRVPPCVDDIDTSLGGDTLVQLARLFAQHGDAFRMHSPILGKDLFVLSHPNHVRHMLVDNQANFSKGIGIERIAILLGNGLMTSDGALWRSQRKAIQPAFHRTRIASYAGTMVRYTERMLEQWRDGDERDAHQEMMQLTLYIVGKTLFDLLKKGDNVHYKLGLTFKIHSEQNMLKNSDVIIGSTGTVKSIIKTVL